VHEHRPGHLADRQPLRGQHLLAVAPCAAFVIPEALAEGPAKPPCIPAVALPRRQPCAQLVIVLEHGPVPQPFRDLAGRVDDEGQVRRSRDAVDPALAGAAMVDAGRAEARPDGQRGHRMTGLMPGCLDRCLPGGRKAGEAAAVVALPDPSAVHDGFVVVADDPAQLSLDPGQGALV